MDLKHIPVLHYSADYFTAGGVKYRAMDLKRLPVLHHSADYFTAGGVACDGRKTSPHTSPYADYFTAGGVKYRAMDLKHLPVLHHTAVYIIFPLNATLTIEYCLNLC